MELKGTLHKHDIHIAVIQETKLRPKHKTPKFPGYTTLRLDRRRGEGGGLLTLVHKDIPFTHTTSQTLANMPYDTITELQSTRIRLHKQDINIHNIYIPPTSSSPPGYLPQLDYLDTIEHSFILGDPNAHDTTWYTHQHTDARGALYTQQLGSFQILNNTDTATRKPYNINTQPTSPDVSLATPDLALCSSWRAVHELSSDHLPILIQYRLNTPYRRRPRHTYTNYKKADWVAFTATIEQHLQTFNITDYTNIDAAVQHLNNTITNANKKHIPTGSRRHYNPNYNANIRHKITLRNNLRKQPPTPDALEHIRDLNKEIDEDIRHEQHTKWKQILEDTRYNTNPSKLWKLIRGLNNSYLDITETHEAILPQHQTNIPTDKQQSNILNKHYSNISRLPHRHCDRRITRRLHSLRLDTHLPSPFTPAMTVEAIRRTKNTTSTGPDGISYLHLRHLGPQAVRALTDIFNFSLTNNSIPNIWKLAKITPLLKPNKPPTEPASYRPISLLCNPSKILERLVLNNISPHITLSPTQHGFRSQHSTATLLTNMTQTTLEGLNSSKPAYRSLIATIDISKAFDTVPRHLLIEKILDTHIHQNFKKWLANFLSGRHGYTLYNGKSSRTRHYTNGVPQGSVLSPTLFNLYMHDIPTPTHTSTHTMSYADDLTIMAQHPKYETAATHLQDYIDSLETWLTTNRLKVSTNKSTLTLITPYNREYNAHPVVTLYNTPIPLTNTPTVLGVTLDRGMTFKQHTDNINTKAKSRLNVLRSLTHTTYGHSKEDITTLYKQYIRPILTYAHTAWQPDLARTHMQKLQTTQNTALRIATGCTLTTPTSHIHEETHVLPLKSHMDMRGTHAFTSTADPSHPLHYMQTPRPTSRYIHNTPAAHYLSLYSSLPPVPPDTSLRTHIHSSFTSQALAGLEPNSLLGTRPPPVNSEELLLPRTDRVHLARLRCGHHPALPVYMHRIGRAPDDSCAFCLGPPGSVEHVLLHCPHLQQHRDTHNIHSLEHLWTRPAAVVNFLRDAGVV